MTEIGIKSRWAAIGAAVAVVLGGAGVGLVGATSPTGAVAYVPIEPCRAADTRSGPDNVGRRSTPLRTTDTHVVNANDGDCSGAVPASATGLQLNITALNATAPSFITVWASGDRPTASSLNPTPGQPPVPNAVTTGIDSLGDFRMFNNAGDVDVVVDIVGFYTDHDHDDRYYTEAEVDSALDDKADTSSVYTRTQTDSLLGAKANTTDVYTRTQTDNLLDDKADTADVYTQAEVDTEVATAIDDSQLLSAVVQADGTLVRGIGVTTVTNPLAGEYIVNFDRVVSACTYVASPGVTDNVGSVGDSIASAQTLVSSTSGVFVRTQLVSDTAPPANTNTSFHLVVLCPES